MRVICLIGKTNSGKTSTIKLVYNKLINGVYNPIPNHRTEIKNDCNDFLDIVEDVTSGIRIGIVSIGDYIRGQYGLKPILKKMNIDYNCDLTICACSIKTNCSTDTKRIECIRNYPNHFFILKEKLEKTTDNIIKEANNYSSEQILLQVTKCINFIKNHKQEKEEVEKTEQLINNIIKL